MIQTAGYNMTLSVVATKIHADLEWVTVMWIVNVMEI